MYSIIHHLTKIHNNSKKHKMDRSEDHIAKDSSKKLLQNISFSINQHNKAPSSTNNKKCPMKVMMPKIFSFKEINSKNKFENLQPSSSKTMYSMEKRKLNYTDEYMTNASSSHKQLKIGQNISSQSLKNNSKNF